MEYTFDSARAYAKLAEPCPACGVIDHRQYRRRDTRRVVGCVYCAEWLYVPEVPVRAAALLDDFGGCPECGARPLSVCVRDGQPVGCSVCIASYEENDYFELLGKEDPI